MMFIWLVGVTFCIAFIGFIFAYAWEMLGDSISPNWVDRIFNLCAAYMLVILAIAFVFFIIAGLIALKP